MGGSLPALYPFSRAYIAERQRARAIEEQRIAERRIARAERNAASIQQENATIKVEIKTEIKAEIKIEEVVKKEEDPDGKFENAGFGNVSAKLEKGERSAVKEVAPTPKRIGLTFSDDDELRNNNSKVNTAATRLPAIPSARENTRTSKHGTTEAERNYPGAKRASQISAPEGSSSNRALSQTPSESTSLRQACPANAPAELPARLPAKISSLLRLKRSCHTTATDQSPKRLKLLQKKTWRERFKERQRSPVRHIARRTRPAPRKISKKPLNLPRLCRGRVYKPRDVHDIENIETSSQPAEEVGFQDAEEPTNDLHTAGFASSSFSSSISESGDGSPPTFLKPLSRMIQIRVGEHHFNVYLNFLQWWAPRLADECVSFPDMARPVTPWQIKDVDPDVFGLFVQWIYTQSLLNKHRQPAYQHRCMGLWVLAKRLDMERLQDDALDTLHTRMRMEGRLQVQALGYVYQNTAEGDTLRRYVFDVCRKQMNSFP